MECRGRTRPASAAPAMLSPPARAWDPAAPPQGSESRPARGRRNLRRRARASEAPRPTSRRIGSASSFDQVGPDELHRLEEKRLRVAPAAPPAARLEFTVVHAVDEDPDGPRGILEDLPPDVPRPARVEIRSHHDHAAPAVLFQARAQGPRLLQRGVGVVRAQDRPVRLLLPVLALEIAAHEVGNPLAPEPHLGRTDGEVAGPPLPEQPQRLLAARLRSPI